MNGFDVARALNEAVHIADRARRIARLMEQDYVAPTPLTMQPRQPRQAAPAAPKPPTAPGNAAAPAGQQQTLTLQGKQFKDGQDIKFKHPAFGPQAVMGKVKLHQGKWFVIGPGNKALNINQQTAQQAQAAPAGPADKAAQQQPGMFKVGPDGFYQIPAFDPKMDRAGHEQQRQQLFAFAKQLAQKYADGIVPISQYDWSNSLKLKYAPAINDAWNKIKGRFTKEQADDIRGLVAQNVNGLERWKIKDPQALWEKLKDWNARGLIGRRAEIKRKDPKWGMAKPTVWYDDPFLKG